MGRSPPMRKLPLADAFSTFMLDWMQGEGDTTQVEDEDTRM